MRIFKKIGIRISEYFNMFKAFGPAICIVDIINRYLFNENRNAQGKKWHIKKYNMAKLFIKRKYSVIIDRYKYDDKYKINNIRKEDPIWIFWYQGLKDAPELIKICVESVKRYSGVHEVIVVTKENINYYVDIPDYIYIKLKEKKITLTHFSDILRMALLAKHGGIWFDATLYCTGNFDPIMEKFPLFTIKHGLYADFHVCKGMWSGFFFAAGKENPAICFFRDMFYEYWQQEDWQYCYYLIDVIIAIGYENIPIIRELIDNIPYNNKRVFELQEKLNSEFNFHEFANLKTENFLHKLSYKTKTIKKCHNKVTYYGYLAKSGSITK